LVTALLAVALSAGCRSTAVETPRLDERLSFSGVDERDIDDLEGSIAETWSRYAASDGAPAYLDDAAYELAQWYRERGHAFATVGFQLEAPLGQVVFKVDPGPRVVLSRLDIGGALWLSREEAESSFDFPEGGRDGEPVEWFTRAALERGLRRLENRYYDEGFLDVVVSLEDVTLDRATSTAEVAIDVIEGARFRVRRIELINEDPALDDLVRAPLREFSDRPFTPEAVPRLRTRMLELLGNAGYPDGEVTILPDVDRSIGAADLRVVVEPGELVTVGEVRIEGAETTRSRYVLSRLKLRPGDRYSRERARASFERLYRSGLFDRVAVRLDDTGASSRDLIVELLERPPQEVFIEPGYGAYELARLKAGYRHNNILGSGRQLRIQGVAAVRSQGAEIGIAEPNFFRDDLLGDLSVGYEVRDEPSFTREETSATFSLRWPWIEDVNGTLAYEYRQTDLVDVDIDVTNEVVAEESIDASSLFFSPQYDSRDNIFVPTAGATAEVGIEWASSLLGSELDFIRATLTGTRYLAFDREGDMVLAFGARIGWIVPSGGTESIPLQERFFNGGPTTVRAFRRYELGPQDGEGNPIGGEGQTIFNAELRKRIAGNLHGALFYDVGSVVLARNWVSSKAMRVDRASACATCCRSGPCDWTSPSTPTRARTRTISSSTSRSACRSDRNPADAAPVSAGSAGFRSQCLQHVDVDGARVLQTEDGQQQEPDQCRRSSEAEEV
jgi:outer membrane protein assembly complex protein YaeT